MIPRLILPIYAIVTVAIVAGCGSAVSRNDRQTATNSIVTSSTRSCGYQGFGKGWFLRASRTVSCRYARTIFRLYFSTHGCNRASAGT